jgi:hypothetical protein
MHITVPVRSIAGLTSVFLSCSPMFYIASFLNQVFIVSPPLLFKIIVLLLRGVRGYTTGLPARGGGFHTHGKMPIGSQEIDLQLVNAQRKGIHLFSKNLKECASKGI